MTDQEFKAPPVPPKAPAPVFMPKEHPQETAQRGLYDDNFAADLNLPASVLKTKTMGLIMAGVLLFGIIFGSIFFGGSGDSSPKKSGGLQGVVRNMDLDVMLPRCGTVERGQACILYLMNSSRYDKTAEDFFDEAVRLMEVSRYSISMVNTRYAKQLIRPGYFAQIKIPNVR